MQRYTFKFNEEYQDLCVIISPVCKYKHMQLDFKCSPDFANQVMEQVLCGLEVLMTSVPSPNPENTLLHKIEMKFLVKTKAMVSISFPQR